CTEGFTLVEVLVAVLVLAIGLLGMAGLQAVGLKNNNTAYLRSQATFLAYELADRMRANNAVLNEFYGTVTGTEANPNNDCTSAPCSQQDMAKNDIYQWLQSLQSSLPMGTGTVTKAGAVHTITIKWDDNRDGVVENCTLADPCFVLSVQP
ncbi:MAG: type IV pilus modification protein PilV, partial [Methylococcaceae bacterium]|nr:type IV pilus modification protein PilV [Methylococcaceae bacterium]